MEQGLRLIASRQILSCMLGLMLLLVYVVKKISKTDIACLIVRLEGKLVSRPCPPDFLQCPLTSRGTTEKWRSTSKFFGRRFAAAFCASPLSNCFRRH